MLSAIAVRAVGLLYPPTCWLCGAPGQPERDICVGCEKGLPLNARACARCALPFDVEMPAGALCGRCQAKPPPFDRCVAPFRYELAIPSLIAAAKFRGQLNAVRLLAQCLARRVGCDDVSAVDALVPVPLHPARLRERGYNQSLEMARVVGAALDLPVDRGGCERVAATAPQSGLDERARRRNIRGAFVASASLRGARVAILDDVVTTGSTVAELSRVLRRAGAESVAVWAVARTP